MLVLALEFAGICALAAILNVWLDESFTLASTSRDVPYAFHEALVFEQNAPLYFVLLTVWRHVNESDFFLRLFSILCAAGTVALLPGLARRYLPQIDWRIVTLAVAFNPFLVWAALEIRVYALTLLISAILLHTYYDAFIATAPRRRAWIAYTIAAVFALYTQYYFAFFIAAQGALLAVRRRAAVPRFALSAIIAGLALVPMARIVASQVANFREGYAPPSLTTSALTVADIVGHFLLPIAAPHASIAYAGVTAVAIIALIFFRRQLTRTGAATAVVLAPLAALCFTLGIFAGGVWVVIRHASSLYVLMWLGLFGIISFFRKEIRPFVAFGWLTLAVVMSAITLAATYAHLAKPGDWKRVARYVEAHEHREEPIAIFDAENTLAFAHYYRGGNRIVGIPNGVDFDRYDVRRFVLRNDAQLDRSMPRASRFWFVTVADCTQARVSLGCSVAERYVARYHVFDDRAFYGARARLLGSNPRYSRK